jgi:hypothetical protein
MIHIFKFNLLKFIALYSKEAYLIGKRSLKKASKYVISASQYRNVFVPTTRTQIRI